MALIFNNEMMEKADIMAKSLVNLGIRPEQEVAVCMTNVPELVYILLAINKVGAKANVFGEQFDHEYIKEILNDCNKNVIFSDDSRYCEIENAVREAGIKQKVIVSLTDSLPKDVKCEEGLEQYYDYSNRVDEFKSRDSSVVSYSEMEQYGLKFIFLIK